MTVFTSGVTGFLHSCEGLVTVNRQQSVGSCSANRPLTRNVRGLQVRSKLTLSARMFPSWIHSPCPGQARKLLQTGGSGPGTPVPFNRDLLMSGGMPTQAVDVTMKLLSNSGKKVRFPAKAGAS